MAVVVASDVGHATTPKQRRQHRHRPLQEQKFTSYLSFGFPVTVCLAVFLGVHMIVLLCASPLLQQEAPREVHLKRGTVLRPVVENIKSHVLHPRSPHGAAPEEKMTIPAGELRDQADHLRKHQSRHDSKLIDMAQKELDAKKQRRDEAARQPDVNLPAKQADGRKGFVVLGMHRSGTSMLGGLLVNGLGYNAGSPLIGSAFDNEKGFFELIPAVLQNDEFMNLQRVWWSANVLNYDSDMALQDKASGKATFQHGQKALAFFNNPDSAPWMQKDPRMCITLPTWLPLFNSEPAVLWTYRHPIEVAHSLIRREASFTLDHALRLWVVYNMRGIQNSRGLCRVYSSNEKILSDPLAEVQRLSDELTKKCGVPPPPNTLLTQEAVDKFIDTSLVHHGGGKKKYGEGRSVIEEHNGGDCKVYELETDSKVGSPRYQLEIRMYKIAMKMYCDMQSGEAYEDSYDQWPELS